MSRQARESKQYVKVPIAGRENGLPVDPTTSTVTLAFVPVGARPVGGDWKAATWETDSTTSPPTYLACCLVGPGGAVTLTPGEYKVWWQLDGPAPEAPIGPAPGTHTIT